MKKKFIAALIIICLLGACQSGVVTSTPTPTATAKPTETPAVFYDEILYSIYPYGEIVVRDINGGTPQTLVKDSLDMSINSNRHAVWLPDNSAFSYTVDDFTHSQIWRVEMDGEEASLLIDLAATDSAHAWSPDGTLLAYVSTDFRLMIHDTAAGTSMPLTDGRFRMEGDPDWSADGAFIAFSATAEDGNQDIYTFALATGVIRRITDQAGSDSQPDWSPNGNQIAFSSTRDGDQIKDIFIIDLRSGTETENNLPRQISVNETEDIDPDWSPDGSRLLFTSHYPGAAHGTLMLIDLESGEIVQVTAENTYHSPQWRPQP